MRFIMRLGLGLPRRDLAACPCRSARPCASSASAAARSIGVSASHSSMISAWPSPVWVPHLRFASATARSRSQSKPLIAAMVRDIFLDRFVGQAPSAADLAPRCCRAGPERGQAPPGAARTPADIRRRRASPSRRLRHWTSPISRSSPLASASAIRSASVRRTSSCSARPSIGWNPGTIPASAGKGREQATGRSCGWSGSSARRGSRGPSRTTAARVRAVRIVRLSPRRIEVGPEFAVLEPHPSGEPRADAVGHLGRRGLGEGQAQDRFRPRALQQQAQHARGQHLRLAGPRRGRKRRVNGGVGRPAPARPSAAEGLETRAHAASQAAPNAIENRP